MRKYVFIFMLCNTFMAFAQYCNMEQGTVTNYLTTKIKNGQTTKDCIIVEKVSDEGGRVKVEVAKYGDSYTPSQVRRKINRSSYVYDKNHGTTEYVVLDSDAENQASRKFFETGYPAGKANEDDFAKFREDIWAKGKISFLIKDDAKPGDIVSFCNYEEKLGPGLKFKGNLHGQYLGTEKVDTPAGSFECVKINTENQGDVLKARRPQYTTEWYAKGIGLVKSESYDKRGKVTERTVLQSITPSSTAK